MHLNQLPRPWENCLPTKHIPVAKKLENLCPRHASPVFLFIYLGRVSQLVGSQFLEQVSNLSPQQWKRGVLTTGPSGKSLFPHPLKWR